MSIATIDFEKKEITLTIPYESAADMAMAIEIAQDACDKRMDSMRPECGIRNDDVGPNET